MATETNQKTAKDNTKLGAVIILVISAIVFIPFGGMEVFNALFNKNKSPLFGKYKGREIRYERGSTFTTVTENLAERYKSMGYNIDSQSYYYLFTQAFAETVKDMAYLEAVEKTGYKVPEEAANRILVNYYTDETGKYSAKIYNQTDKATKKSLREGVTQTLAYSRYTEDLLGSSLSVNGEKLYGLKTNSKEVNFINNMGKDLHAFTYVAFDTEKFPKEEAAKWAANNKDKFEKYDLSAVTLADKTEADALYKKLTANEITFEDAVVENSEKYFTDDDGKLSRSYRYQLEITIPNKEEAASVASLATGSLSPVIQTSRGYTIFRCDGSSKKADLTDDETLNVVLTYIKTNEHGYIENYYSEIANDFRAQAALTSFEEASEAFEVTPVETTAFPINYGTSSLFSGVPTNLNGLANLPTNDGVMQKIFALKENETSAPMVLSTNVMVFKCLNIISDDETKDAKTVADSLASIDEDSATQTLLSSDKVENNIWDAYFNNFVNVGE